MAEPPTWQSTEGEETASDLEKGGEETGQTSKTV